MVRDAVVPILSAGKFSVKPSSSSSTLVSGGVASTCKTWRPLFNPRVNCRRVSVIGSSIIALPETCLESWSSKTSKLKEFNNAQSIVSFAKGSAGGSSKAK